MGYWRRCDKCDVELPHPDLKDALIGVMPCPECHHEMQLDHHDRSWRIDEMLDRLASLEVPEPPQ